LKGKLIRGNTLQLRRPFGRTFGWALALAVTILAAAEGLARSETVQAHLPPPGVGSSNVVFEFRLHYLDTLVKREGRVDCLFVGNSMTVRGVDPEIFAGAYRQQTGEDIICFNFGIRGATASTIGPMAEIFVERYHPRLLIYGSTARDYGEGLRTSSKKVVLDIPWTQYQLGRASFEGWLISSSYAYRQYLALLDGVTHRQPAPRKDLAPSLTAYGFDRGDRQAARVDVSPDLEEYANLVEAFADYRVSEEDLQGLAWIVALEKRGVEVVIVEMPLPPTALEVFGDGEADYRLYLDRVGAYAQEHDVPFWRTHTLDLIPDDGWRDHFHLNLTGAEAFSAWLGEQVGQAVEQGLIEKPTP
jgi:hypothetical protein